MSLRPWPQIEHPDHTLCRSYADAWRLLAERIVPTQGRAVTPSLWDLYAARYCWDVWPVGAALDRLWASSEALLPWVEWELFRLSGDETRLRRVLWRAEEGGGFGAAAAPAPFAHMVACTALADAASALHVPAARWHDQALALATQIGDDGLRRLAAAWVEPAARVHWAALVRVFRQGMERLPAQIAVTHGLLLWTRLRRQQLPDLAHALAAALVTVCQREAEMLPWLSPLVVDGVLGLEADAAHADLRWWLFGPLPMAISGYRLGRTTLSLRALPAQGGTQVEIECGAPLTLEILTAQTSFVETLAAGRHTIRLTVLDRTDVAPNPTPDPTDGRG